MRVLRPGGWVLIADIRHDQEYAAAFAAHGCPDVRVVSSRWVALGLSVFTIGSLRPVTLLVRKAVAEDP